jgi:hypothetical protein
VTSDAIDVSADRPARVSVAGADPVAVGPRGYRGSWS